MAILETAKEIALELADFTFSQITAPFMKGSRLEDSVDKAGVTLYGGFSRNLEGLELALKHNDAKAFKNHVIGLQTEIATFNYRTRHFDNFFRKGSLSITDWQNEAYNKIQDDISNFETNLSEYFSGKKTKAELIKDCSASENNLLNSTADFSTATNLYRNYNISVRPFDPRKNS